MHNRHYEDRGARLASRPARNNGLTLIELLVSITILSFIAILGWRGLDSIVRSRIALTGDLEQTRGMQLAFAQMQSDCAHLASAAGLPDRMPLVAAQERLTLVRTVLADNQPSRLQVITYRIRGGVLSRHESVSTRDLNELGILWRTAANDTGSNQEVALLSNVAAMTMRLWVSGNTGWRTGAEIEQLAAPPAPAQPGQMPSTTPLLTGLEVALQLQGHEKNLLKIFLLGAV